jgi:hypothetical protein
MSRAPRAAILPLGLVRLLAGVRRIQSFQFFVTDDRYRVPTLKFVDSADVLAARSLAQRMLENPHHRAVEVWDADRALFTLVAARRPDA